MSISKEAIEAAARALWSHGANTGTWHWEAISEEHRDRYRAEAAAAITAAAPFIQAAALRDAADGAAVEQPFLVVTWLRARADQLEGETK